MGWVLTSLGFTPYAMTTVAIILGADHYLVNPYPYMGALWWGFALLVLALRPIDATHVRLVCTRNAARDRVDEARKRLQKQGAVRAEDESAEDRARALDRVSASVGFFYVSFS